MVAEAPAQKNVKRKASRAPAVGVEPAAKKTKGKAIEAPQLLGDDIPGQYRIWSPYIKENWEDEDAKPMNLKLAPSLGTGRHLWGAFHFQVVEGVMRGGPPPKYVGDTWEFMWRGTETGEGEIMFPNDDGVLRGSITFLGDGKIKGTITGDLLGEEAEFTGRKLKTSITSTAVKGWKKTFRSMNELSFGMRQYWKEACAEQGLTRRFAYQYGKELHRCADGPAPSDTSSDES
ncbi:hypothetical protein CALVIDRAFT_563982 [Calocera viscosa TUFC12733]|uniref:Uncharacterized protein n=1 Tax=Calocera viscosa (strain TUFC12733) TaxID=1330018 RepID=A0A167MAK0_CALVF|nr:hypothetical protein CALVIDRAFT_563982 [Calocera viscosa TUFC12733]